MHRFANVTQPLHNLTQKGVAFSWNQQCEDGFLMLKGRLTGSPILVYPQFGRTAGTFVLATDASAVGIEAVLEQDGHIIADASYIDRTAIQCHPERTLSCYACNKAVSPLLAWLQIQASDRPCTITVAVSPEDGRAPLSLGPCTAGV